MAVSLKHNFNCAKADGVDATAVKPSDWNAEHVLTASAGKVLGTPAGSTTVSELPIEVDPAGASVKLPSGATASRPVSPAAGMTRYNTSTNRLEYYTNGAWKNVDNMTVSGSQPATAIAGDFWLDTASGNVLKQYTGTEWVTAMPDGSVTYAKLQNVSATSRVLGRKTAGAGVTEELTLSELLDFVGSAAQGDLLYRSSSGWARLAAGTAGQVLQTGGSGANPSWVTPQTLSASQNLTGQAQVVFSGIPAGVRKIEVAIADVSTATNVSFVVRVGTSAGLVGTGYKSTSQAVYADSGSGGNIGSDYDVTGFVTRLYGITYAASGVIRLINVSGNIWVAEHTLGCYSGTTPVLVSGGGVVTLSDALIHLQLIPLSGNFDGGVASILY